MSRARAHTHTHTFAFQAEIARLRGLIMTKQREKVDVAQQVRVFDLCVC